MAADRALIGARCEIRKRHVPKEVGRLALLRPPSKLANGMDRGGFGRTSGRYGRLLFYFLADDVNLVGVVGSGCMICDGGM